MKFNLFADSSETKFWNYFQTQAKNHNDLIAPDFLKNINDTLNKSYPGLGVGLLITFNNGQKKTNFYVTAYGDKSKFPLVDKLVKKAPQSDLYKIIALAPASYLTDSLVFNEKNIPTDEIEFSFKRNHQELDISVYFPVKPAPTDNEFELAFQSILLESLGELQFSKLGLVEIKNKDEKSANTQTKKLRELYNTMTTELK